MLRFCLLTLVGTGKHIDTADFMFQGKRIEDLSNPERRFNLTSNNLALFNPNTLTCPIFYTNRDAELTQKVYQRVPVLENERTGKNQWGASFLRMFDMSNDSNLFITEPRNGYVPLYESKMFYQFTHRHGDYGLVEDGERKHVLPEVPQHLLRDPNYLVKPHYWIPKAEVENRLHGKWSREWLICFRNVTDSRASVRTLVFSVLPSVGVGNSAPLLLTNIDQVSLVACLLANLCSIVLDYITRQKVSGLNLNFFIVKQLPILPPESFTPVDVGFITPRVLELVYTAYDLKPFAEDMGYNGEPFHWDEERRALLRAELDAYYAKLYGLTRDELRYILDPQDVYGPDFPGETFRVLKDKEIRQFGEYRTRRLVLEAWDRLEGAERVEEIVKPLRPAIDLPVEVITQRFIPEITWIPVTPAVREVVNKRSRPNYRQAVGVAWLLENFGTGQSIPSFDAHKYSYFLQRKNLADLDIPYREAARGPYSPQLTYKAGAYAKNKNYWEVRGSNIVRRRNMKEAVDAADKIIADIEQARQLIEQLAGISKDDLGGFATVDFSCRAIFDEGQAITPDNIRAYFLSDWPEKVDDPWYTDENIHRAIEVLGDLGLFEKSEPATTQPFRVDDTAPESVSQPMLTDFGLYKCLSCEKMVMGFEKEKHFSEKHGGRQVEWKRIR